MSSRPFDRPQFLLRACSFRIPLGERTAVMAVLNCTPDSFSDGGLHASGPSSAARLQAALEEGADCVDIGGESTRPGASAIPWEEEWRRIEPVMREVSRGYPLPVSVDTTKPEVAERSLEAGASMINDVNGLRQDARLADLAARTGAALILMHMRGTPRTMQRAPSYRDVTVEVAASLRSSVEVARTHHVPDEQLLVDPGIGFGKTAAHNYTILRELPELARIGLPILVGASRKAFLGKPQGLPVSDRLEASIAAHVAAVLAGAHVVRVHDVRATVRAVRIADEILRAAP